MFAASVSRLFFLLIVSTGLVYAQDAPPLELGKPLQRELASGQSHSYPLTLGAQQFLNFVVEQRGINVEILLFSPDQNRLLKANSSSKLDKGQEFASVVAETTGPYQLVVRPIEANTKPGAYTLTLHALRPATAADTAVAAAFKSYVAMLEWAGQKKNPEAIAAQEQTWATLERQFGPTAQDAGALKTMPLNVIGWYIGMARNIAKRYLLNGNFNAAEPILQRELTLWEIAYGKDVYATIVPLNDLADVYTQKGDFARAEAIMRQILATQQKASDANGAAISTNNLATFLYRAGNYVHAENHYRQAQTMWETLGSKSALGPKNGIALIQFEWGDYDQAEKLWLEVLSALEAETKPSEDLKTLLPIVLGNLGGLYYRKGNDAKAETYWLRALEMRKRIFSPTHPEVVVALNRLADVYYRKGETVKAENHYAQGLALLKGTKSEEHVSVAYSLSGLAYTAQKNRDYAKAATFFQDALRLRRKLAGEHHPEVAETLGMLASLYQEIGDGQQALLYQAQANEINETNLRRNLLVGCERQKQTYLSLFTQAVNQTLGLHAWNLAENPEAAKVALTALFRSKGRSLDAMSNTVATFRQHADSEQQKLFDRLLTARTHLANLTFGGLLGEKPEQYRAQLKRLEGEIDTLEADLCRRSAEFASDAQPITLSAIQAALPPKTSLIEFAAYQPCQFSKQSAAPTHYLAYVLNADGTIRWKDLGEAAPIDQAIEALRQALRDETRADVRQLARNVDEKVMQPLRPFLANVPHLLISPDGKLNLLPFAALVNEQDQYLIERYTISYLTSGRDLLRLQVARTKNNAPLILADPDFDLNGKATPMTLAKRGRGRRSTSPKTPLPRLRGSGDDFSKLNAERLFETGKEAEAIKALLPESTVYVREKATKAVLQQINAPSILHVATHGFFLEDAQVNGDARSVQIPDPLLRSGLILAGFNQHRSEGDNGVLTAREAAGLNLWGTKLVVLSACETGIGEVKNGEGVYGLRRALMLAGAQTQVMSLWKVDDTATREWMTIYYTGLQQGLGRSEALRQVQLKLLQQKRRQHPYYWASFISSGEWANLDGQR